MSDSILPTPRDIRTVLGDLHAHREMLNHLRDLAGQFYALDFRPLRIIPEGSGYRAERVGEFSLPRNLDALMREEAAAVAACEADIVALRAEWIQAHRAG
jgi:hypothetical protein